MIEERPVSLALSDRVGVKHESPQALLVFREAALWHASHGDVTERALRAAVVAAGQAPPTP